MELPDFPSSDYFSYINHEKEFLLIESTSCLNSMRDYLERNVFCNVIGGNFQDIVESLTPENMMDHVTCHPSARRILKMLRELMKYLSKENQTLDELLRFTDYILSLNTVQGIILPFAFISIDDSEFDNSNSFTDKNRLEDSLFSNLKGTDEEKKECQTLWNNLSERITFLSKLFLCSLKNPKDAEDNETFGKVVETLFLFNFPLSSWKIYKESRQKSFELYTTDMVKQMNKVDNLETVLKSWETYVDFVMDSLTIDYRFIGILFKEVSNAQDAILNYYLDTTVDEIKKFLDNLTIKIGNFIGESPKTFPKGGQKVNFPDNNNQEDISTSFTGINASSIDLKSHISPFLLNVSNFKTICKIISCFARIENRIDSLLNSQWSTPLGVNIDSSMVTKKPKGVLKKIRRPSRRLSSEVSEFRVPEKISSEPTTSPVFEEDLPTYVPCIEWQSIIKPVFPSICTAFEYHLNVYFEQIKLAEKPKLFFIEPLNQPSPVKVSESLQEYLRFIEDLLPFILVCYDSPVEKLVANFHNCLKNQISKLHTDFQTIASNRQSLDVLFLLLSDSSALQLTWSLLNNLFKPKCEEVGVYFFEQKKLFSDFQKIFSRQLIERCFNELVSVVLQDSKSNFWNDLKEFHENTRVGYPIQAWHLYLQKLWYLLSTCCSIQISRDVLSDVLMRSLEFLVQRYAAATPSKRRIRQARADMVAILFIVDYFIYKVADNVDDLFGFGEDLSKLKRIHFSCMSLLQIILVLTGPVDLLSRFHGQGFNKGVKQPLRKYYGCFWMNVIRPERYKNLSASSKGIVEVDPNLSNQVAFEIFLESKQFETTKVVEIFCHNKMNIPRRLLVHLSQQLVDNEHQYEKICSIFVAFFRIMSCVTDPFNHFHSILIDIIENSQGWSEFHQDEKSRPVAWLAALYEICTPYIESIVTDIINYRKNSSKARLDLNSVLFSDNLLPCGCECTNLVVGDDKDEKTEFLKKAVQDICKQAIHLPLPVQSLLAKLQEQLDERNISVIGNHLVFDVLLESVMKKLRQLNVDHVKSIWMEIINQLEENESIQSRKDMIVHIFNKRLDDIEVTPFQEIEDSRSSKSFFLGMQYNQISSTESGLSDLKTIDKFIRINASKLKQLLGSNKFTNINLDVNVDESINLIQTSNNFNPIKTFCKIGSDEFDHKQFYDLSINWDQLCSTDIGMTEISFETILSHRWELDSILRNEDMGLTEDLINATKLLIDKYGLKGSGEVIE